MERNIIIQISQCVNDWTIPTTFHDFMEQYMTVNEIERFWKVNKAHNKIASNAQLTLDQTL